MLCVHILCVCLFVQWRQYYFHIPLVREVSVKVNEDVFQNTRKE